MKGYVRERYLMLVLCERFRQGVSEEEDKKSVIEKKVERVRMYTPPIFSSPFVWQLCLLV